MFANNQNIDWDSQVKDNKIPFSIELIKQAGLIGVVNQREFEEQVSMFSENYFDYKLADKHVDQSFKIILDNNAYEETL